MILDIHTSVMYVFMPHVDTRYILYHIFRPDGTGVDRVVVGDLRLSSSSEYHLSISPQEIIVFPGYNSDTFDGDIALIKLSERIPFSHFVRPACSVESVDEAQNFSRCMISGWGDTETGGIFFFYISNRRKGILSSMYIYL